MLLDVDEIAQGHDPVYAVSRRPAETSPPRLFIAKGAVLHERTDDYLTKRVTLAYLATAMREWAAERKLRNTRTSACLQPLT